MSGTGRGNLRDVRNCFGRCGTGWETNGEVRDGSGDIWGGPGRVKGPLGRSGTGLEKCGTVEAPTGRSKTGQETLREVRDGLGDPRGGPERVGEV